MKPEGVYTRDPGDPKGRDTRLGCIIPLALILIAIAGLAAWLWK
jgi:hypothetical protein